VLAADAWTRQQVFEERLTIARELHDLLAHNLSVMHVQTGAALHLLRSDPDRAEESLRAARDAGRSILDELRELLAVLRDDEPDESGDVAPRASLPTVDDVAALVNTMRSAGLAIVWTDTGAPQRLAPAVSLAAYRIVQEALTNAAKHGDGTATLITEWNNRSVTITVINPVRPHGITNKVPSRGHGLVGMRERALTNGGSLEAGETASDFEVRARLPVATQDQEAHQ
jgi:signal transduction histidine kinase